jgi:hypothetical protein
MAHFTQLGLSGHQDKKPETKPQRKTVANVSSQDHRSHSNANRPISKPAVFASLIAAALLGLFLLESGCSKESDKASANATPNQTVASPSSTPTSTVPVSTSAPAASQPPAKKKSRQRKLSASTYTNPTYGVSFRYPKYDSLREGDAANLELDGLGPVEMNFIQPGGTTISAVEVPRKVYAGTDFDAAFFNVSMNSKLTPAECGQFAFPETGDPETDPVTVSKTKVGATEFNSVEGFAQTENTQADVKYYHVFQNGNCYEFALGLETALSATPDKAGPTLKTVDPNEVFRQLNWILSTTKIVPVDLPEATLPPVATETPSTPASAAISEAH